MTASPRFLVPLVLWVLVSLSCGSGSSPSGQAIPVSIIVPSPAVISSVVNAPCRLEASSEAVVSVLSPCRVLSIEVSEGDSVAMGETLARLSTDRGYEGAVSAAAAGIVAARSAAELADSDLRRTEALFAVGGVSLAEYQQAVSVASGTGAALASATAIYSGARSAGENASMVAPFDGIISRVWESQGSLVSGPLISIAGEGTLIAEALVAESHLVQLHTGLPAFFSTGHYPGEVFAGELVSFSPDVDPLSGLVPVRVQLTDDTGSLRSGMTGTLTVALETAQDALVLPISTLIPLSGGGWEAALVEDGLVRVTAVTTGISGSGYVEITSGISFGDSVVALGHHLVETGDRVRPVGT